MTSYLVCHRCGKREPITEHTRFVDCRLCCTPRYAEDAKGRPLVVLTELQDPSNWELQGTAPKNNRKEK